jgi:hypothetical protein
MAGFSLPEFLDTHTSLSTEDWSDEETEAYVELMHSLAGGENAHQVGGYPAWIQEDAREEAQRLTEGPPEATKEWNLLWQLGTDEEVRLRWGASGKLFLLMRDDDLRACRFDRAWLVLQSTRLRQGWARGVSAGHAGPGFLFMAAPAAEVGAAGLGDFRITSSTALEQVTDRAIGTGGMILPTGMQALPPQQVWPPDGIVGDALLALGAGGLLAVLAIHGRAEGHALVAREATLAIGAAKAFARGQTGRAVCALGAEESLGATRWVIQLARTTAPPVTQEPWPTAVPGLRGQGATAFSFFADSYKRAEPDASLAAFCFQGPAGETLLAVTIRDARAVRTVALLRNDIEEAGEGRLAVRICFATALIGLQAQALLTGEHGNEGPGGGGLWPPQAVQDGVGEPCQWKCQQDTEQDGQRTFQVTSRGLP